MRFVILSVALLVPFSILASPLRVGVVGSAPYVIHDKMPLDGISVDVWNMIAQNVSLSYQLRYYAAFDHAKELLQNHELDVLIGPIAITSSLAQTTLVTQAYHRASLGMAVPEKDVSTWDRVKQQLATVSGLITTTICLVLLVAFLLWRIERKTNSVNFPKDRKKGLNDSIWFTVVTMMGVGYGDKVPITHAGRIISAVWMLIGVITVSSLTAGITTFFTVASIPHLSALNPAFLKDHRIAVSDNTSAKLVIDRFDAEPIVTKDSFDALQRLSEGRVKAVVADRVELQYYVKNHPDSGAIITDANYEITHYGFAFSNSRRAEFEQVNVELLRLMENGSINEIVRKWTHQT